MHIRTHHCHLGFGLVETVVATGIFLILASGGVTAVLQGQVANRLTEDEVIATTIAREGIEAVSSIKKQNYASLVAGTYGLSTTGNLWAFSGSSDTQNGFTRQIVITQGRSNGGNIVDSGGGVDPDFMKVVSTVTWNFSPTRSNTVSMASYVSNFKKSIASNWTSITPVGPLNLSGNDDGVKVASAGDYAYVIRASGSSNFVSILVSNPSTPSVVGSLTLTGTLTNVFVVGNRAYVTSTNNNGELYVVNISNPASPVLLGTYNAPGNEDGNAIWVSGTTGYLVRSNGGNPEFVVLNLTNPASVAVIGGLNLAGNAREIAVLGSNAYIASTDNNQELQVVSFSTPSSPSLLGTYNAAGSNDALSVVIYNTAVLLGDIVGNFYVISVVSPTSPVLMGSVNVGDDINDIAVDTTGTYAFLATDLASNEFRILSVANPSSPTIVTSSNLTGTAEGVAYNESVNRVFIVSSSNNVEFLGIQPN